jgi:hypothetical protein
VFLDVDDVRQEMPSETKPILSDRVRLVGRRFTDLVRDICVVVQWRREDTSILLFDAVGWINKSNQIDKFDEFDQFDEFDVERS